ncbi:MAG: ECF-type sigma factor, partial [Planctomycetota bacterium]
RKALKRGGDGRRLTLDDALAFTAGRSIDLLALDEALTRLAALNARQARVVELRFFGGLTEPEVAEVAGVSRTTVADDWAVARAWLSRELSGDARP